MRVASDRANCTNVERIPIERGTDIRPLVVKLGTKRQSGLDVRICEHTPAGPKSFFDTAQSAPVYEGRVGLTDAAGTPLLVDWRTPAAEPLFAATLADPRGVTYRRRWAVVGRAHLGLLG